jgi:hypothetical protein
MVQPTKTPDAASAPKSVEVTVVELAGARAYVQPGGAAGVHRGTPVLINQKEHPVIEASDSYAVIEVGDKPLHERERGRAILVADESDKPAELPKPRPLETWRHAWREEQAPADAQQPRFVPIGTEERNRRFDVRLTASGGGIIPVGGQVGSPLALGELNARMHAEPFAAPFAFDLDASLQSWAAADLATRVGGTTRSTVYVRELLASYTAGSLYAGIGRLRYAASTLGTLDGARVEERMGGGFSAGAFGGFLPNPLSGAPSVDAQRFGVEARYSRPDAAVRPEAALVLQGSTFQGTLDERRLSGVFGVYPGLSRVGGYFEVSGFDANNPWRASPVELTAAGIDASVRLGPLELGARFDARQPERSRWLAFYLPASWFCTTVPAPGANLTAPESCNGDVSTRAFGEVDAGLQLDHFSLFIAATAIRDLTQSPEANMTGGFASARVLRIARTLRFEVSGNYSSGSYLDMFGGTAGPGMTLLDDALDVSAYYRVAILQYRSESALLVQNGAGGTIVLFPSSEVLFTLQGEGMSGDDARALMLFGSVTWRPRL